MSRGELPLEIRTNGHTSKIKLFDDHKLLAIWRSNFKGIQWQDKQGNILKGAVDNILMKGKKLIILEERIVIYLRDKIGVWDLRTIYDKGDSVSVHLVD